MTKQTAVPGRTVAVLGCCEPSQGPYLAEAAANLSRDHDNAPVHQIRQPGAALMLLETEAKHLFLQTIHVMTRDDNLQAISIVNHTNCLFTDFFAVYARLPAPKNIHAIHFHTLYMIREAIRAIGPDLTIETELRET